MPTAFFVALKPLTPFRQAQHVQVFPLKPAPFSKLSTGLGSTNKSVFLFSYLTLALSSPLSPLLPLSFYLNLSGRSGRDYLFFPPELPGHLFLSGNDAADDLARWGALSVPSAIPCSLSSLISRIHSAFFSDWRRTVSSKFFDKQVPSVSTEELVLPFHARCALSRLRCKKTQPSVKLLSH